MDLANAPLRPVTQQDNSGLPQQPQGQAPQPQGEQYFGKMKFHLSNGQQEGFADEHQLVNDLRTVGYNPLGVSSDGMTVTLQGPNGPYEVKTPDVLQKMGWQVKGMQPLDVDNEHVSPEMRFIIESPGIRDDDHAKQAVLTSRLQRMGLKEPQVVGAGSDWYVFNPGTSQYIALTNKPGFDMGDLGEVGARAGGILGNAVGSVLGTPADVVGGPAGTILGAASGGFVGNRATDLIASGLEPSYAPTLTSRPIGEGLKTVGGELATDALAGLGGYGMAKLGGAAAGVLRNGLASRMLQAGGQSAELGGRAVQGAADFMGSGIPRELGVAALDPTGASMYGEFAQAPQAAVRGAARGLGSLGETKMAQDLAPEAAARMRDLSSRLLQRRGGDPSTTMGGQVASALGRGGAPQAGEIGAEEIMGNAADMLGQRMGRQRAAEEIGTHEGILGDARLAEKEAYEDAVAAGHAPDVAKQAGQSAGQQLSNDWTEAMAQDYAPRLQGMRAVGTGIDNVAKLGSMAVRGAALPYDAALGAARAGGRALRYGGRAARSLGEGLGPLETPMELKYGSEELVQRLKRRQAALQRQGYDRTIVPDTLAQN